MEIPKGFFKPERFGCNLFSSFILQMARLESGRVAFNLLNLAAVIPNGPTVIGKLW